MNDIGRVVFDASVVLALFLKEARAQALTEEISHRSVLCTVNLAEVQSKLVSNGYDPDRAWQDSSGLVAYIEPFSRDLAKIAGDLIAYTKPYGLSLGDRSCLALAISLNAPIYTTERVWRGLDLGIPIHILR